VSIHTDNRSAFQIAQDEVDSMDAAEAAAGEVVDGELVPEYAMVPVLPNTGEAIVLADMEDRHLALLLDQVRQFESDQLRGFRRQVQEEILGRMDQACSWTVETEEFKVSGDSPDRVEYDLDKLRIALAALKAEGLIDEEAAEAAIRVKIEYEPAKAGINKLLKRGGRVKEVVLACEVPSQKARAVRLTLKTNGGES
jgi:hypothetical protein